LEAHRLQDQARQVAEFLNHSFDEPGVALPASIPEWLIVKNDLRNPRRRRRLLDAQLRLKDLVSPALDALADGRSGANEVERLVFALGNVKGQPYRFEKKLVRGRLIDEWE